MSICICGEVTLIYIDDLVGAKYKPNGRNPIEGFDCFGLAIEVSKRFGHELFDIGKDFEDHEDFHRCELICLQNTKLRKIEVPQMEGDIILLRDSVGVISHIGIYLGDNKFIHCNKLGVHIDRVSRYKDLIGRVYTWL